MRHFDFLSESPKMNIFQRTSNKTKFGGVLFILYLIIMFFISLIYILDFALNEKYEVNIFNVQNGDIFVKDQQYDFVNDPELDAEADLRIILKYENLILYDPEENKILEKINGISKIKLHLSKYNFDSYHSRHFHIFYKCKNSSDCSNNDFNETYITIQSPDFIVNHKENQPFEILDKYYIFEKRCKISSNCTKYENIYLKYMIYKDIKGISKIIDKIFSKREKYVVSYLSKLNGGSHLKPNDDIQEIEVNNEKIYVKNLFEIYFQGDNSNYMEFNRKTISIFDVLATVGALFTTLKSIFSFIFGLYSYNFDNYKIVEKIISRTANLSTKEIKDINDEIPKEQIELKDQIESDKGETLLEVNEDNKKMVDDNKEKESNLKPVFKIPKFHFYDFLYNNVYCDCCKPSSTQGIISSCNDLISKYYSIDAVIYNQLRLDNLFKDYKWNNPQLNNITNNDLISQIKTLSGNITGS